MLCWRVQGRSVRDASWNRLGFDVCHLVESVPEVTLHYGGERVLRNVRYSNAAVGIA